MDGKYNDLTEIVYIYPDTTENLVRAKLEQIKVLVNEIEELLTKEQKNA